MTMLPPISTRSPNGAPASNSRSAPPRPASSTTSSPLRSSVAVQCKGSRPPGRPTETSPRRAYTMHVQPRGFGHDHLALGASVTWRMATSENVSTGLRTPSASPAITRRETPCTGSAHGTGPSSWTSTRWLLSSECWRLFSPPSICMRGRVSLARAGKFTQIWKSSWSVLSVAPPVRHISSCRKPRPAVIHCTAASLPAPAEPKGAP
mmetsp:Transcript_29147/g.67801  ORF Transcript_29147/g.67801 Transcript_29147/m.67801 type:complete len:207 (+) Transcript_29147:378-998(+)